MKQLLSNLFLALYLIPGVLIAQVEIDYTLFTSGLDRPLAIETSAGSDLIYIVEQDGRIQRLDATGALLATMLDITDRVNSSENEQGLLGLVFDPDYPVRPYCYVNYTAGFSGDTRISRFTIDTSTDIVMPASEQIILEVDQPFGNHNAGDLEFGPDGYLYIPLGDGGNAGDPQGFAQNPLSLLGKMLRIDVETLPYQIPEDNPFAMTDDVLDEIWALGLRNPFKIDFDPLTGDLYIADVGQNQYEEINYQPFSSIGGENYGWNCMEGPAIFDDMCTFAGFVDPVYSYEHIPGAFCTGSISGGILYRGDRYPDLQGHYLYSDFCTGVVGAIRQGQLGFVHDTLGAFDDQQITSFGVDNVGQIYFSTFDNGSIYVLDVLSSSEEVLRKQDELSILHNPVADGRLCFSRPIDQATMYDMAGREVTRFKGGETFVLPELPTGAYTVLVDRDVLLRFVVAR